MDDRYSLICRNLESVRQKILRAAEKSGRNPEEIHLVVVSKGQPIEVIQAAVKAGITLFGENYPEEALEKIHQISAPVAWHMIGHMQSRKIPIVIEHFNFLHSLDSVSLAEKMSRQLLQRGVSLPVLLEVNIGGEASKYGWNIASGETREIFFTDVARITRLDGLQIRGLMTMPPYSLEPEKSRVWFRSMCELKDVLMENFPGQIWNELSMGTSQDFIVAIEEGATFVRIGEAILGARLPKISSGV